MDGVYHHNHKDTSLASQKFHKVEVLDLRLEGNQVNLYHIAIGIRSNRINQEWNDNVILLSNSVSPP